MDFLTIPPQKAATTKIDIYILAGQSNASGTTKIELADPGERDLNRYEAVRYYTNRADTDGTFPCPPHTDFCAVAEGLGYNETRIGPELGMAQALAPHYDTEAHFSLILKVAAGGTSIRFHDGLVPTAEGTLKRYLARGSWCPPCMESGENTDPARPSGFLLRAAQNHICECLQKLLTLGFRAENIRFCALCWMQGETDRKHPADYPGYFHPLMADIRRSLSEAAKTDYTKLPVIVGEISETFFSAQPDAVAANRAFIQCQHRLAETDPTVTVLPTGKYQLCKLGADGEDIPLGTDHMHWAYRDMLPVGRLFGEAAYRLSHN